MKYLITGAAGFVGTNLTKRLLDMGEEVVAVDSLSRAGSERNAAYLKGVFPRIRFFRREIEDVPALIYTEQPDQVFHFAAQVAVTSSMENPVRDFRINAEGTFNVAKAAYDIDVPVIYTSTNKVYGNNVNLLPILEERTRYDFATDIKRNGITETFSIDADHHTPYGVSKLVGEFYVREFGGIANRCSCMYGPHQFGIADQGWLSHFATNRIKGRTIVIYGNGKQVRDVIHVSDVIDLLVKQSAVLAREGRASLGGQVYNVGGGYSNTISLLELCERWDIRPSFSEWRAGDQKVFYCDITKAKKAYDWSPRVSLGEGLAELYRWTELSMDETKKIGQTFGSSRAAAIAD
jgi:CDP-paratose 2-epimerase